MFSQVRPALIMLALLTVITGIVYPTVVLGLAQALFPYQANGSLIVQDGQIIGSELIGQRFVAPHYFQPRPSAAGTDGYDAANSAGSNLGPTNAVLIQRVQDMTAQFHAENPLADIPVDLATASGSGLDPHITPAAARFQAPRVAAARGISEGDVLQLVGQYTEERQLGILGERRVNVLALNLALDRQYLFR